jgi:hypothetical protein
MLFLFQINTLIAQVDNVNTSGKNTTARGRSLNGMNELNSDLYYDGKYFIAKYMQKPPVFPYGADSIRRYCYFHFDAFETVLNKAIEKGDTAKYIRIYFQYVVDKNGTAFEGKFLKVASTAYPRGDNAKTIKYFNEDKEALNKSIKELISKMPFWKPGLNNNVPVDVLMEDYIQFWVGINPPPPLN